MSIRKISAFDLLNQVMQTRNWHGGKLERRLAGEHKRNLKKNKLSYEKAVQLLEMAGWQKIEDETFAKNDTNEN
jgi:hypothetical protein